MSKMPCYGDRIIWQEEFHVGTVAAEALTARELPEIQEPAAPESKKP
jgi:hypothetical protein